MPADVAEHKLREVYAPAALDFLYDVMNDTEASMEHRMLAARTLAVDAAIPHPEDD